MSSFNNHQPSKRETLSMLHKLNSISKDEKESLKSQQKQKQRQNDYNYTQRRLIHQMDSNDDFLTMILVNASFSKLLFITKILLQLVNSHHHHKEEERDDINISLSYSESFFSEYTPIVMIENDVKCTIVFGIYYNTVYEEAVNAYEREKELQKGSFKLDESPLQHLKKLLKACFLISFVYDVRIRRFVMARHLIHYQVMKTKPPNPEKIKPFIEEIRIAFINPFLSSNETMDIIQMVNGSINSWIFQYMTSIKPKQDDKEEEDIPHIYHQ